MIERVHQHLTSELRQNTRTDTIFIITALLLNLVILAVNSSISSGEVYEYDPSPTLMEGTHTLYIEVRDDWNWRPVGQLEVQFAQPSPGNSSEKTDTVSLDLQERPNDIRYQLDSKDESGWAVASERKARDDTNTLLIFIFLILQVFVNIAVIFGLLKGKKMRLVILDGLLQMYRDQKVDTYYNESLLRSYSVRYYIFISIVLLFGLISIIVPLIIRYM